MSTDVSLKGPPSRAFIITQRSHSGQAPADTDWGLRSIDRVGRPVGAGRQGKLNNGRQKGDTNQLIGSRSSCETVLIAE